MPINKQNNKQNNKRKNLLKKCGLPDVMETSHCFADTTHHTCCMLGKNTREYANSTGNPIGSLSVKVQKMKNLKHSKKTLKNNNLTPWCSCTGSKVCTYYTNKFGKNNKTHIKFISNFNKNNKNENKAISKLNIFRHKTPGIISS